MVAHWRRKGGARMHILLNGLGAVATAATVIIVIITKFVAGAWITTLLIPLIMLMMFSIRRHYERLQAQISEAAPLDVNKRTSPIVVMPMMAWTRVSRAGLQFAMQICTEVHIVHVTSEGGDEDLASSWRKIIEEPLRRAGMPMPQVKVLKSPYRFVIAPIVDYVLELEKKCPGRQIAVIIPELVEKHWYHSFLHNRRATWLKAALLMKGNRRIVIIDVPWYVDD